MGLIRYIIPLGMAILSLLSCTSEKSLQQYLVDKQDDDKFLKIDIATSLLQTENSELSEEEQKILATIKKINVVAYKIQNGDAANYEVEKEKLAVIINQDKYKTLIKYGSNNRGATLKYLGEEDAIDEVIVFASDNERGFAIFRLLGEDMRPDQIIKLMNSVDKGDIDLAKFASLGDLLKT